MPRLLKRLLLVVLGLVLLAGLVLGVLAWNFFARHERVDPPATAAATFHSPYYLYTPRRSLSP